MSEGIGRAARRLLVASAVALAGTVHVSNAQAPWPQASWNPHPESNDLVLPLPCGGSIAFRPVTTPMPSGPLADRPATLGWTNPETDYTEYLRHAFVAGGFHDPDPTQPPRFFMAKYEVTVDQYAAVVDGDCAKLPTPGGRLPKANVAWFEAVTFTSKLSAWLIKNAKDKLPREGEGFAFARLATEDEWEYAARGGAKATEAEFSAQTFPMPNGILRYAWFQGTRSAGGSAHPIGQLEPNQLGLYDILGNVAEWTFEPFRMNKAGRPHGLAGAQTARGGDYLTPEDQLRSALRVEVPTVNVATGDHYRSSRIGLRPVLARNATPSDDKISATQQAFQDESKSNAQTAEDPLKLLEALRKETADPATQSGLTKIETTLRASNREIRERQALAIHRLIQTSAYLARQIAVEIAVHDALAEIATRQADSVETQRDHIKDHKRLANLVHDERLRKSLLELEQLMQNAANSQEKMQHSLAAFVSGQPGRTESLKALYVRNVAAASLLPDKDMITEEAKVVQQELESQSLAGDLPAYAKVATAHILAAAKGNTPTAQQVAKDILAVLDSRTSRPTNPAPQGVRPR